MSKERLDKLIASQGLMTRSEVKQIIKKGLVTVNGAVVKDSALKVSFEDSVLIDGEPLLQKKFTYIMKELLNQKQLYLEV